MVAAVLLAPLALMFLGLNASSALGLWFAALAVGIGVWVYWYGGRSFEADLERLREEWRKTTAPRPDPTRTATTTPEPVAEPPAPVKGRHEATTAQRTTVPHETTVLLRCPDCAEDVVADAASCPYCEHQYDVERLATCRTCDRRVEAIADDRCPACGSRVDKEKQITTGIGQADHDRG